MKTILILAMVMLTGCASIPAGIEITEDERATCAAEGCTVWTETELGRLIGMALRRGYEAGRANKGQNL